VSDALSKEWWCWQEDQPFHLYGFLCATPSPRWLRDNVEKLRKSDLEGGGLALPCQPWGEATLKKHPHLSDLKKWLERYGFCIQQVRTQMG
jgi:hypothetical protein